MADRSVQLFLNISWQSVVGHIGATWRIRLNLCTLWPLGEYDGSCASFGPFDSTTQMANRSVQPFLHSSQHIKIPVVYRGHPFFHQNYPFACGDLNLNLIHGSLGPPESSTQTASWLVKPFCTAHHRASLYFTMGRPFPLKIAFSYEGMLTPSNTWFLGPTRVFNPNGISIGSAVFARLTTVTDQPTDHTTRSLTIGRIYVRSTVMWPNNNKVIWHKAASPPYMEGSIVFARLWQYETASASAPYWVVLSISTTDVWVWVVHHLGC